MTGRMTPRIVWPAALAALIAVLAVLSVLPTAHAATGRRASDPAQSAAYQRAYSLGIRAYVYGYPLLDTNRVFRTATSINVPDGNGGGPVDQFSHIRHLTGPADKTVVAPNHDTLYSIAWLNLAPQPVVVHLPVVKHRFIVLELLDPYTTNFANIGAVGHPPGNYAVVPPGWHGHLPTGVHLLRSSYTRVWIIGRTYIRNAADTPNVVRIQNELSITPLSDWGTHWSPSRPRHPHRVSITYTVPGSQTGEDPMAFFNALGDQLKAFRPPAADRPLLAQLATVGIGPGLHPGSNPALAAATRQGLRDAVGAGALEIKHDIQTHFLATAPKHDGWMVASTGRYGTDYETRAIVDAIGLGAPLPTLAIYPFTITDFNLHPLTGSARYVAHIQARDLPFPVRAFWSLTMYDSSGYFVPNPANVYLINNRSNVHYNPDGSLDIYIQPAAPGAALQRRNWLPSPAGRAFRLIMRLYLPTSVAGILGATSWQPPKILPCLAGGKTTDGVSCAS